MRERGFSGLDFATKSAQRHTAYMQASEGSADELDSHPRLLWVVGNLTHGGLRHTLEGGRSVL